MRREQAAAAELAEIQRKVQEGERAQAEEAARKRAELEATFTPEQKKLAEELHAQQNAAASMGFGTEGAAAIAQQVHFKRVDEIVLQAQSQGVEVNGAALRSGTLEQTQQWAKGNFK